MNIQMNLLKIINMNIYKHNYMYILEVLIYGEGSGKLQALVGAFDLSSLTVSNSKFEVKHCKNQRGLHGSKIALSYRYRSN